MSSPGIKGPPLTPTRFWLSLSLDMIGFPRLTGPIGLLSEAGFQASMMFDGHVIRMDRVHSTIRLTKPRRPSLRKQQRCEFARKPAKVGCLWEMWHQLKTSIPSFLLVTRRGVAGQTASKPLLPAHQVQKPTSEALLRVV